MTGPKTLYILMIMMMELWLHIESLEQTYEPENVVPRAARARARTEEGFFISQSNKLIWLLWLSRHLNVKNSAHVPTAQQAYCT